MGHVPLLYELAVVVSVANVVTVILSKFKLPTLAGLLAAGALLGPFGFGLATSVKAIEVAAEVGTLQPRLFSELGSTEPNYRG